MNEAKQKLMEVLQNKKVQTALMAGAGTGLAGGFLSSRTPQRRNETRWGRRRRILRDMLLSGAVGAGATGAAMYGWDQVNSVLPATTQDPVKPSLGIAGKGILAGGAGFSAKRLADGYKRTRAKDLIGSLDATKMTDKAKTFRDGIYNAKDPAKSLYANLGSKGQMKDMVEQALNSGNPKKPNVLKPISSDKTFSSLREFDDLVDDIGFSRRKTGETSTINRIANLWKNNQGFTGKAKAFAKATPKGLVRAVKRHPGVTAGAAALVASDPILKGLGHLAGKAAPNIFTYDQPQ